MEALLVEKSGLHPSVVWEKFCIRSSRPTQESRKNWKGAIIPTMRLDAIQCYLHCDHQWTIPL